MDSIFITLSDTSSFTTKTTTTTAIKFTYFFRHKTPSLFSAYAISCYSADDGFFYVNNGARGFPFKALKVSKKKVKI